uniref:Uncharacterized protein n=1 Tax=Panagrolaimus sp. ES5 TaxID=591445 RepID=A0AC34GCK3_9BILA
MKLKELNDAKVEFIVEECFKINDIQSKSKLKDDSKNLSASMSNVDGEKEMKLLQLMTKFDVELRFHCESKK